MYSGVISIHFLDPDMLGYYYYYAIYGPFLPSYQLPGPCPNDENFASATYSDSGIRSRVSGGRM